MSVLVLSQDFETPGALGSPWAQQTNAQAGGSTSADVWTVGEGRVTPLGDGDTFRRAILTQTDPYALLAGSSNGWVEQYSVETQAYLPEVFSATDELLVGLALLAPSTDPPNSVAHFEWHYHRSSGGTHLLRFGRRLTTGAYVNIQSMSSFTAAGAGDLIKLRVDVNCTAISIRFDFFFDDLPVSQVWRSSLALGGNPPTLSHRVGYVATVPGPTGPVQSTNPLYPYVAAGTVGPTNPARFDNLRVRDIGSNAEQPVMHPEPTLTAAATLSTISVTGEDDSTGDSLPIDPSYVLPVDDQYPYIEQRYPDGGYSVTVAKAPARRRRWAMTWDGVSSTNATTFATFVLTVGGVLKAWDWTDPDTGDAVKARFVSVPVLTEVDKGPGTVGVFQISAEVEEVLT